MTIEKVINNNIVSAFDETGREVVVMGRGIGFGNRPGAKIPEDKIEKIFRIESGSVADQFKELLAGVPLEHAKISSDIISYAKGALKLKLNQSIYVTLTDHINFAIARCAKGINLENALLWEIKRFYPQEYELRKICGCPDQRASEGRIARGRGRVYCTSFCECRVWNEYRDALRFPNQMKEILEIVTRELGIKLDEGTLHYERFITHMKFLLQRVYRKELLPDEESDLADMISQKYPKEFACSKKVADYIEKTAECRLSGEEVMYLAIHIRRITMAEE